MISEGFVVVVAVVVVEIHAVWYYIGDRGLGKSALCTAANSLRVDSGGWKKLNIIWEIVSSRLHAAERRLFSNNILFGLSGDLNVFLYVWSVGIINGIFIPYAYRRHCVMGNNVLKMWNDFLLGLNEFRILAIINYLNRTVYSIWKTVFWLITSIFEKYK